MKTAAFDYQSVQVRRSVSAFSKAALDKVVREALPLDAKPGERVVVGAVDAEGVQVVATFAWKSRWELQAAARHAWGGDTQVGGKVLLRW